MNTYTFLAREGDNYTTEAGSKQDALANMKKDLASNYQQDLSKKFLFYSHDFLDFQMEGWEVYNETRPYSFIYKIS